MIPKKLLIIESDTALVRAIEVEIKTKFINWQIHIQKNIALGNSLLNTYGPDFLYYGHDPQKKHHQIFLSKLKSRPAGCMALIFLNQESESVKLECFNKGADHVLLKPFKMEELICKTRSLLRLNVQKPENINYAGINFDLVTAVITYQNHKVKLTRKEAELLYYLIKEPGKILSRSKLMDLIWPERDIYPNTIEAHIENLRKKLFTITGNSLIKTAFGSGYYFEEINSANLQEIFNSHAKI